MYVIEIMIKKYVCQHSDRPFNPKGWYIKYLNFDMECNIWRSLTLERFYTH